MSEVLEQPVDTPKYTPEPVYRRLVLELPSGLSIVFGGTVEHPAEFLDISPYGAINLVACKRTYYLYRPVMVPRRGMANSRGDGSFKPSQR